jgi:hypothetical protein
MDINEIQNEVEKEFSDHQSKLFYYTIALCVTAIGFSVYQTVGKPLAWSQIPLGLAVLCWGLSIYCGFTFLRKVIANLWVRYDAFNVLKGTHELSGNHPEKMQIGLEVMYETSKKNSTAGMMQPGILDSFTLE